MTWFWFCHFLLRIFATKTEGVDIENRESEKRILLVCEAAEKELEVLQ